MPCFLIENMAEYVGGKNSPCLNTIKQLPLLSSKPFFRYYFNGINSGNKLFRRHGFLDIIPGAVRSIIDQVFGGVDGCVKNNGNVLGDRVFFELFTKLYPRNVGSRMSKRIRSGFFPGPSSGPWVPLRPKDMKIIFRQKPADQCPVNGLSSMNKIVFLIAMVCLIYNYSIYCARAFSTSFSSEDPRGRSWFQNGR